MSRLPLAGALLALALATLASSVGQSQPRRGQFAAPPPAWARSVEVLNDGAAVFTAPRDLRRLRRGTIARGTRLPLVRRLAGPDCPSGYWYQVGAELYMCTRHARPSQHPPSGIRHPSLEEGERLPRDYAFIRSDGALAYARPSDYFLDTYVMSLGRGFGVVVQATERYRGVDFVRTEAQLYIARSDVGFARGSEFAGHAIPTTTEHLAEGARLDFGWVRDRDVPVYEGPRRGRVLRRLGRRTLIRVGERESRRGFVPLADGGFVQRRSVSLATPSSPPESLEPGERWIDVSVAEQVAVAYEGERPVFATLVSTGRDRRGNRTPLGEHRIWVKLAYSDMSNLSHPYATRNYAIEDVPWVQYFEGDNGLHAAFWHDDFGNRRSHGCVNLSPLDARTLFDFTEPALPDGWKAIFPTEDERATLVRVRE